MRLKKAAACLLSVVLTVTSCSVFTQAAFEPGVEAAYNTAVQGQDALDGLDVVLKEKTVSSSTNISANKTVNLKVSGMKGSSLKAEIQVDTDEGTTKSYYQNGYYYATVSGKQQKREMDRTAIWDMINTEIYMNMTSNYLRMLYSETAPDGNVTYYFAATAETLGDYSRRLLEGSGGGQGIVIDGLQGSMQTNAQGNVIQRTIQMIYTVLNGDNQETFMVQTEAQFKQNGQAVAVELPDLSSYQKIQPEKPVATITPLQYNGSTGYIWSDYTSTRKPVRTSDGTGTMYATAAVNVRDTYSSEGLILGTLQKGQGIEITGMTDNNWIRVKYNGHIGYVYADYLSWSEPVSDTYVENGYLTGIVTDASFGTLTIQQDDGLGTAIFNTTYAVMNLKDTIYTGDWVEVYYTGAGVPYTASMIRNNTVHNDAGEERSVSVEGVIVSCSPSVLELSGSDGLYRTFRIEDTDMEIEDNLSEGQVVTVTWMSRTNGAETRNIEALRIKG